MSKHKKKRGLQSIHLSTRTKVIAAVVAIVVVLAVVAVVLAVLAGKTKQTDDTPQGPLTAEQKRQAREQEAKDLLAVANDAQTAMERGDSNKVAAIYDSEIKNTKDTTRKIKLLVNESGVYISGGKYDKAIEAAKKAESLSSDKYLAANQLARAYRADKQYALAAQYYTLTGKSVGSPDNVGEFTKEYYDKQAADMQARVKGGR